jgi:hypothetical protein
MLLAPDVEVYEHWEGTGYDAPRISPRAAESGRLEAGGNELFRELKTPSTAFGEKAVEGVLSNTDCDRVVVHADPSRSVMIRTIRGVLFASARRTCRGCHGTGFVPFTTVILSDDGYSFE